MFRTHSIRIDLIVVLCAVNVSICACRSADAWQDALGVLPAQQGVIGDIEHVSLTIAADDEESLSLSDLEQLKKDNTEKYSGGAPLKTNPELEELMKRAELFAADGSFRNATLLWQRVLEKSGDSLYTVDGETYYSLAREVERRISKLPADGMRVYRVGADGETKAVLAEASGPADEDALSKIVDNFFLSSIGDEAAFDLGCLALDHHDFVGASRLFSKIIDEYPEPTVPLDQVYLRLALANAHVGDERSAREAIAKAREHSNEQSVELVDMIASNIEKFASHSSADTATSKHYPMRLGNVNRVGAMPAPPEDALATDLTPLWELSFSPKDQSERSEIEVRVYSLEDEAESGKGDEQAEKEDGDKEDAETKEENVEAPKFVQTWKERSWIPTGQILIGEDQIFFRTMNDVTSWSTSANSDKPVWRSLWLNKFERDELTIAYEMFRKNMGRGGGSSSSKQPETVEDVFFFGDRIQQSMLVHDGVLYAVEGKRYSRFESPKSKQRSQNFNIYSGTIPRRTRTNYLTAYDARTGKLIWQRAAADVRPTKTIASKEDDAQTATDVDVSQNVDDISFMSAPVPYGKLLLCPISEGGAIWIYGIDQQQKGKTVWKSYLCDEPGNGAAPWSPIEIAVEGRDAYVVCGTGAVFALDAVSGTIRFARRYVRDEVDAKITTNYNRTKTKQPEGWADDVVIPFGNALVVMASDHDRLFAIDRRSGEFIWEAPRHPLDDSNVAMYCMGVYQNKLYVGGPHIVICYDLAGEGRLRWVKQFEEASLGRGFVCSNGVYVPVADSIVRLDLDSDKIIKQVGVKLKSGEPVGNLYCDGKRIWVMGANKVYALTNIDQKIKSLDEAIESGSTGALGERMHLLASLKRYDESVSDFNSLLEAAVVDASGVDYGSTFKAVSETKLIEDAPGAVLIALANHVADIAGGKSIAVTPTSTNDQLEKLRASLDLHSGLVYEALSNVPEQPHESKIAATLTAGSLLPSLLDQHRLSRQLVAIVQPEDLARLRRHVTENRESAAGSVMTSLKSISRLSDNDKKSKREAISLFESLLKSDSELVRYAAAFELADAGEKSALPVLIDLLNSEDNTVRVVAGQALLISTGQELNVTANLDRDQREVVIEEWKAWLEENGDATELRFPVEGVALMKGLTLVCVPGSQSVLEFLNDDPYTVVRKKKIGGARYGEGQYNGDWLVATFEFQSVVKLSEDGEEKTVFKSNEGKPSSVQQLANGNLLIALSRSPSHGVIEVNGKGEVVWDYQPSSSANIMHAVRLATGNTLVSVTSDNVVIEVNRLKKEVWKLEGLNSPYHAQRLADGNTLVTEFSGRSRVAEFNHDRKMIWEKRGLSRPQCALRLPNGNTLIGQASGLIEVDSNGKQLRSQDIGQVTSIHRF